MCQEKVTYHLVLVCHLFPTLWGDQEESDLEVLYEVKVTFSTYQLGGVGL